MQRLSPTSVSLWRHNPYDRFIREVPSLRRGDFFCIAVGGVGVVCGKGVLQCYRQFANKTVDWGTREGIFLYLYIRLQYGGLLRVYVCDGMTGMGCPEWEVQVSRPSPASAQQQLSDASTNIYINTNLLKFKPTMKRRSEFVGGGKYTAPVCEVVAVSTVKGLCLSPPVSGSLEGWIEDDFEW